MYYENFERLCREREVTPSQVSRGTDISTATLTSWKKGKYTPKQDKLQKNRRFLQCICRLSDDRERAGGRFFR